jgi:hypothetical protein
MLMVLSLHIERVIAVILPISHDSRWFSGRRSERV